MQTERGEIDDNDEEDVESEVGVGEQDHQRTNTFWRRAHQTQRTELCATWRLHYLDQQ